MEDEHGSDTVEPTTVTVTPTLSSAAAGSSNLVSMMLSGSDTPSGAHPTDGESDGTFILSKSRTSRKRSSVGMLSELQREDVVSGSSSGQQGSPATASYSGRDAERTQACEAMSSSTVAQKLEKLKDTILGVPPVSHSAQLQTLANLLEECAWDRIFGTNLGLLPRVPPEHQETLERDGQAAWSLPPNLRKQYHAVWVEGDGNSFWRALAVGLWKSQYYHVHLKLFVLAMSAKRRTKLVSDERLLHKMITLGGSVSGNSHSSTGGIRTPHDVAKYERMLLEAIGYHCGDLRHTGRLMACLTCEALAMTVKLVNPTDLIRYLKALSVGGGLESLSESQGDSRHSALCVPVGGADMRWCMPADGQNGEDDFSPNEMAMVITKYSPSRRRALESQEKEGDGPTVEKDLHLTSLNHFATLVDVGWRGLPFPLDVAAPPLNPTLAGQAVENATRELMEWDQRKTNGLRGKLRTRLSSLMEGAGLGPWPRSPSRGTQAPPAQACSPSKADAKRDGPSCETNRAPSRSQRDPRQLDEDLPGLIKFWTGRIQKTSAVRTYSLSPGPGAEDASKGSVLQGERILGLLSRPDIGFELLSSNSPPSAQDAPLRREEDFVAGHLSSGYHFWADVVLKNHEKRETLLGWLQGVSISEFVEPTTAGTYEGHRYSGEQLTSIELPNRVALEHQTWVDAEVKELVERGSLVRWVDVADAETNPRPAMSLPLTVVETNGRRLLWDGQWLNFMCHQPEFQPGGVAEVAQLSWPGAHQVTMAFERGMDHVPLNPDSWKYFGVKWKGVYYVWTVLCSGWCSSAYVYHTLSDAVAQFLRSKDIPALACMDELWIATLGSERQQPPEKQVVGAGVAAYVALSVLYHCGYFIVRAKCNLVPTTRILFLGVTCDTARCRFEVPEDRLAEMEASLTRATSGSAVGN